MSTPSKSKLALHGGKPTRTAPWPIYPQLGKQEEAAVVRVVRSNHLCAQFGKEVSQFEAAFAAYLGVKHAMAVTNGTTALHVALSALGVGPGDEVIVPSYTFLATATSVLMQNAVPVFADADPVMLGLDLSHVKKLATRRTKAILPVHPNGLPVDMDPLLAFAADKGLSVIEDCSHAHGAEYKGRKVGTFGHINIFSFQQQKNLSLGEGGILTTDDDALAEKARAIRSFGEVNLAYNYRMTELHAAVGRVRLKRLDKENATRIRNAEHLQKALAGVPGIGYLRPPAETKAVYYNFIVVYDPDRFGVPRERFIEAVRAEGIPVMAGYSPVHRHRSFRGGDAYGRGCPFRCPFYDAPEKERPSYADGTCPVVEEYCDKRNVQVKVHPPAAKSDMDDVAAAIRKVVENIQELAV
jgi:perosamine synthetase